MRLKVEHGGGDFNQYFWPPEPARSLPDAKRPGLEDPKPAARKSSKAHAAMTRGIATHRWTVRELSKDVLADW